MCLEPVKPKDNKISPAVGNISGLHVHFFRTLAGVIHELLNLIRENRATIDHPIFRETIRKLHHDARPMWAALVSTANDATTAHALAKMLLFARNKIAFHYDAKEIARGYKLAFIDDRGREPFLSRGVRMAEVRFYFADAAADEYMKYRGAADF